MPLAANLVVTAVASLALAAGSAAQNAAQGGAQPGAPTAPAQSAPSSPADDPAKKDPAKKGPAVLTYTLKDIDGKDVDLAQFKGKVVMLVNVASRCGLTPQYEALEALYRAHKDKGLVILGFPANDFMGQEPGTEAEIKEFCTTRFDVTFPMFSKISVKGDEAHPLYRQIAALPAPLGGESRWNFTKILVDREGNVADRFEPRVAPDDPKLVARVQELLNDPGARKPDAPAAGDAPATVGS